MFFQNTAIAISLGLALASATAAPVSTKDWRPSPNVVQADAEWSSLTRHGANHSTGNFQSTQSFTPSQAITLKFDFLSWGSKSMGGDGFSVYLFDSNTPNAGANGKVGGGLGYCGLAGAYLGIGFDEFGNFASSECNDRGPKTPSTVTLRGSQGNNYAVAGHFTLPEVLNCKGDACTTRQQAISAGHVRHAILTLVPKDTGPGYNITLSINGKTVMNGVDYPYAAPASMKVGVAASSGDFTNNHEVSNLTIEAADDPCATPESLVRGVPAYISGPFTAIAYPILNDGDRVQAGWSGVGRWTNVPELYYYGLDFSGAECIDQDGVCAAPAAKGPVTMNTVVVYSRQDDGKHQEPTDSTVFTQYGAVDFTVEVMDARTQKWRALETITGNNLVKRTITFPAEAILHMQIMVEKAAGGSAPAIVEVEAFNK